MDRLTEYIDDSPGIDTRKLQFYCDVGGYIIGDIARRLSAYEDTGMEPEEVRSLRIDMAIIKAMFGDADVKRMKELCEADKEGRVVVLPCRVGDTVYSLFCNEVIEKRIGRFIINGYTNPTLWVELDCDFLSSVTERWDIGLGTKFFLTRAEAEVAIGGGVDG